MLRTYTIAAIAVLAIGCRQNPQADMYIESMNAEKRALEDMVYELQYEYDIAQEELERLRGGDAKKYETSTGTRSVLKQGASGSASGVDDLNLSPPVVEGSDPAGSGILPPKTFTPVPADSGAAAESPDSTPGQFKSSFASVLSGGEANGSDEASGLEMSGSEGSQLVPIPTSAKVTDRLVLRLDIAARSPDEDDEAMKDFSGLQLHLTPRNEAGQFVSDTGPISVVVLDPNEEGDAARVARWDIDSVTATEAALHSEPDGTIELNLPWQGQEPRHSNLHVFVRYHTLDGRRMEADKPFRLKHLKETSTAWTPRTRTRQRLSSVVEKPVPKLADANEKNVPMFAPRAADKETTEGKDSSAEGDNSEGVLTADADWQKANSTDALRVAAPPSAGFSSSAPLTRPTWTPYR